MFIRCPCRQKFYTSTADFTFIGELLYIYPKCGGYIPMDAAESLEVIA